MDISKYRTRFPPKEHEEAVRMLLEGLDSPAASATPARSASNQQHDDLKPEAAGQQVSSSNHNRSRPTSAMNSNKSPLNTSRSHPAQVSPSSSIDSGSLAQCDPNEEDEAYEEEEEEEEEELPYRGRMRNQQQASQLHNDELEFNSEDSNSQDQIQVSPQVPSRHFHAQQQRQQSINKLTNKRLIEQQLSAAQPRMQSRATSTTSDSMSGALRSADDDLDLHPADCESIPNRTIAIQCDLKVSSVKRDGFLLTDSASSDLASMQASSISSTRFGFYKLSPDTLEQRRLLARSISSRNIAHRSEDEEEAEQEACLRRQQSEAESSIVDVEAFHESAPILVKRPRAAPDSASELSHHQEAPLRSALDERLFERRQGPNLRAKSRGRDSLPRRPKTALSYVSNSRLRHPEASDRSQQSEPEDDESLGASVAARRRRQLGQRAMSHQVLSADVERVGRRPAARNHIESVSSCASDSDHEPERLRVPRSEEVLITRHGRQVPQAATLSNYTAARTRPYNPNSSTSNNSSPASSAQQPRRSHTLTNGISELPAACRRPLTTLTNNLDHLNLSEHDESESIRRAQKYAKFASGLATTATTTTTTASNEPRKLSRFNSMSLSRAGARAANERSCNLISGQIRRATRNSNEPARAATGAPNRLATLTRKDRSASQQRLPYSGPERTVQANNTFGAESARVHSRQKANFSSESSVLSPQIGRSTSMKQVNGISGAGSGARFLSPNGPARRLYGQECDSSCCELPHANSLAAAYEARHVNELASQHQRMKRSESDDSGSPRTRTWANPGATRGSQQQQQQHRVAQNSMPITYQQQDDEQAEEESGEYQLEQLADKRLYRADEPLRCNSDEMASEELEMNSATWSLANEQQQQPPLDFDSQQRLNEIGLPEHPANLQPTTSSTLNRRQTGASAHSSSSSSHLGVSPGFVTRSTHYATTGRRPAYAMQTALGQQQQHQHHRGPAITGRAMSQQSLTRPTIPLSRRLRRSGNASGSQSGASDVGGSSMSLVSRLRYENAHTRSPVVMYIPQAMPKSASSEHIKRAGATSSLLRKSSRQSIGRARHSSQDRAGRRAASSRQTSDSEASSSSMLRTLIKPRSGRVAPTSGASAGLGRVPSARRRQAAARRDFSDDEENMDEIGQLATEMDSYKFSRRYSVPKDAKINWFSKLKQRVTSAKS